MSMKDKEFVRKYAREWYSRNKNKYKIYREKGKERNKDSRLSKAREYGKKYYHKNKENKRLYALNWRRLNKVKIAAYRKKYRDSHKEKVAAMDSLWKRENRKSVTAYEKKRKKEDINFNIRCRLRAAVRRSVNRRSGKKANRTMELLGCAIASFRIYIESKFLPGMTWDNIHLDHIVPCALFDLTKPSHQRICFHFSNYQPLFAGDNIAKGVKLFHEPGTLRL